MLHPIVTSYNTIITTYTDCKLLSVSYYTIPQSTPSRSVAHHPLTLPVSQVLQPSPFCIIDLNAEQLSVHTYIFIHFPSKLIICFLFTLICIPFNLFLKSLYISMHFSQLFSSFQQPLSFLLQPSPYYSNTHSSSSFFPILQIYKFHTLFLHNQPLLRI